MYVCMSVWMRGAVDVGVGVWEVVWPGRCNALTLIFTFTK